jgi:hypothetical protein
MFMFLTVLPQETKTSRGPELQEQHWLRANGTSCLPDTCLCSLHSHHRPKYPADCSYGAVHSTERLKLSLTLEQGWANFFVGGQNKKSKMSGGPT